MLQHLVILCLAYVLQHFLPCCNAYRFASPVAMPLSPFCNILQPVAVLSTSPNCPRAPYVLQRLSRPRATPSPLQVATLSTSPVCPPALHVLQHAHARPISCNTSQSALPPRAHVLQHPTVRPFPACACLATPHSPPFPRVRMSCNTSQSALPPPMYCNTYLSPSCITSQPAPPPPARVPLCIAYLALLQNVAHAVVH